MPEVTTSGLHGHRSARKNSVLVPQPYTNGKASYAEQRKVADHFIGGNRLQNAPDSLVKEFVSANDGHTVITNVSAMHSQQELAGALVVDSRCCEAQGRAER